MPSSWNMVPRGRGHASACILYYSMPPRVLALSMHSRERVEARNALHISSRGMMCPDIICPPEMHAPREPLHYEWKPAVHSCISASIYPATARKAAATSKHAFPGNHAQIIGTRSALHKTICTPHARGRTSGVHV